ncbi:MAG: methyltransferase domain-containing protein [Deltaproteobacteria bacterium]|nr:methyltransferase domain-containing protein [Deltaproteobacteria bacterium]MBW2537200.1 methyltransferase domain-containing protein [Deltaproteobacteria bacterium]
MTFDEPDDFRRFREVLAAVEYHDDGICDLTGARVLGCAPDDVAVDVLQRTGAGGRLGCLVRLLYIGLPVASDDLRRAIAPMTLEQWEGAGLIRRRGDDVISTVMVFPHEAMVIVTDRQHHPESLPWDHVMGVGAGTTTLSRLTIRQPVGAALDLGTGCGFLALLAAGHAARVVGIDVNPRALAYARFNAAVNGLSNLTWLEQDMLEPADEEQGRFDLIVSHPPLVIAPAACFPYRDSPVARDGLVRRLSAIVAGGLAEGGFGQFLASWIHPSDERWQDHVERCLERSGCDTWVIRLSTQDAAAYAKLWVQQTGPASPEAAGAAYRGWVDYLHEEGIGAISTGLVTMRKRSGCSTWYRADEAPECLAGPAGQYVAQAFDAEDFLQDATDADFLRTALSVPAHLRIEQQLEPSADGWRVGQCVSRLTTGLQYEAHHGEALVWLMTHCDGHTPVGALIEQLLAREGDIAPCKRDRVLTVARMLVAHGMLVAHPSRRPP